MRARTRKAVHGRPGSSLLTQYKYGMDTMQFCHCRQQYDQWMIELNAKGKEFVYHHHLPTPFTGLLGWSWREGR